MSENIVQIRDFQRRGVHGYAKRVNAKADRAFWMGHTGRGDSGVYLTGPFDLTMGHADPEIIAADSGDCA